MKDVITVGVVIADENEFAPLHAFAAQYQGEWSSLYGHDFYRFSFSGDGRTVQVMAVLAGVGKVNAAAFAALLVAKGVDVLLSAGLSGGISGIARGEFALGTAFVEHDFDLTPLGYEKGVKPGQPIALPASEILNTFFLSCFPGLRSGVMVCGDCFVSDDALRGDLADRYHAISCDMETAAVAGVAALAGLPFAAVRMVSDDAGNDANRLYSQAVGVIEKGLLEIVFEGIQGLTACAPLWKS